MATRLLVDLKVTKLSGRYAYRAFHVLSVPMIDLTQRVEILLNVV